MFIDNILTKYEIIYLNSPETDRPKLKDKLTLYVENHYASDLADTLVTSFKDDLMVKMRQFNTPTKDSSGKPQDKYSANRSPSDDTLKLINVINDYTTKVSKFLTEFKKDVKEIAKEDSKAITRDELDKIFDEQRIKNKTRGLKNVVTQ